MSGASERSIDLSWLPSSGYVCGMKEQEKASQGGVPLQFLVDFLGEETLVVLLNVGKERARRWIDGSVSPSEDEQLRVADLKSLGAHLQSAFTPAQARLWLQGHDVRLGARPIDVFRLEGSVP